MCIQFSALSLELDVVDLAVEEELLEVVLDNGVFC